MRRERDREWWDYEQTDGIRATIASYGMLKDGNFADPREDGAQWVVIWHCTLPDEFLNPNEYTEAEVRHHIVLKYKLLRGERHG
jgi:hypothetical protein